LSFWYLCFEHFLPLQLLSFVAPSLVTACFCWPVAERLRLFPTEQILPPHAFLACHLSSFGRKFSFPFIASNYTRLGLLAVVFSCYCPWARYVFYSSSPVLRYSFGGCVFPCARGVPLRLVLFPTPLSCPLFPVVLLRSLQHEHSFPSSLPIFGCPFCRKETFILFNHLSSSLGLFRSLHDSLFSCLSLPRARSLDDLLGPPLSFFLWVGFLGPVID